MFEVETYRVVTMQSGPIVTLGDRRLLVLDGPEIPSGKPSGVYLYFMENPDPNSYVSKVAPNTENPDRGVASTIWCYKRDFAEWYDILRNERPLYCAISYNRHPTEPEDPDWYMIEIQMYTGRSEPPGEGPEGS
jgi:hypothetical protein